MKTVATVALVVACSAAGWVLVAARMSHRPIDLHPFQPITREPFNPQARDREVMFHEARVKRDPEGAIGWAFLSNAYLARSREEDSYADAIKAEQAARKSLALRTLGNLGAPVRLVNSLLQQHRFLDALAEDEKALKLWGAEPTLTQLHADILIEVGRYDEASKDLISNPEAFNTPGGKAVRAHLDTIQGKLNQALALLKSAHADIVNNSGVESDAISWFEEKMGETHYLMGQLKEAKEDFEHAAYLYPRNYKPYAFLCRIAFAQGDWEASVRFGKESTQIAPMPDILALVGDAYTQSHDLPKAEEAYRAVVALAGKPSGPSDGLHEFAGASGGHGHTLDRQYAMFCADHDRDLDGAYACALRELTARRDVYAFDALAWVCFKRGEVQEAKLAMDRALAQGTQDAQLYYHAGKIYEAAHEPTTASHFLSQALALNALLNPAQIREARSELGLVAINRG